MHRTVMILFATKLFLNDHVTVLTKVAYSNLNFLLKRLKFNIFGEWENFQTLVLTLFTVIILFQHHEQSLL